MDIQARVMELILGIFSLGVDRFEISSVGVHHSKFVPLDFEEHLIDDLMLPIP